MFACTHKKRDTLFCLHPCMPCTDIMRMPACMGIMRGSFFFVDPTSQSINQPIVGENHVCLFLLLSFLYLRPTLVVRLSPSSDLISTRSHARTQARSQPTRTRFLKQPTNQPTNIIRTDQMHREHPSSRTPTHPSIHPSIRSNVLFLSVRVFLAAPAGRVFTDSFKFRVVKSSGVSS